MRKKVLPLALALSLCLGLATPVTAYEVAQPMVEYCTPEEWEVLILVNQERLEQGCEVLSIFPTLQQAADIRESEVGIYYSHSRPSGQMCFSVFNDVGLTVRAGAENIASGQRSSGVVMEQWMDSAGHRANILDGDMAHIGIGFNSEQGLYGTSWVQLFMENSCRMKRITPSQDKVVCHQGAKLEELGVYLMEECSTHGTCYLPLLSGMCSDFDSAKLGKQRVTIEGNDGCTAEIEIEVVESESGGSDPGEITPPDGGSTQPAGTKTANPTNDKLAVNGVAQNPTVYKIGGSNYFKIRDVAAVLNGTEKQFAVGYAGGKVTVTSGQPYEATGKELKGAPSSSREAAPSNDTIVINGVETDVTVYKIGGSNYFKLRDLGKALNFYVGWEAGRGVYIETDKPYSK